MFNVGLLFIKACCEHYLNIIYAVKLYVNGIKLQYKLQYKLWNLKYLRKYDAVFWFIYIYIFSITLE